MSNQFFRRQNKEKKIQEERAAKAQSFILDYEELQVKHGLKFQAIIEKWGPMMILIDIPENELKFLKEKFLINNDKKNVEAIKQDTSPKTEGVPEE